MKSAIPFELCPEMDFDFPHTPCVLGILIAHFEGFLGNKFFSPTWHSSVLGSSMLGHSLMLCTPYTWSKFHFFSLNFSESL
jgi:hypothetical protein